MKANTSEGKPIGLLRESPAWVRGMEATLRISVLLLFVLLFIPSLNPARISEKINRNISLFTSGIFYKILIADMGRILSKGWIQASTMRLLFLSGLASCIGIFTSGAGACMSLGNKRLKRLAYLLCIGGGAIICLGVLGMSASHAQLLASADLDKAKPLQPAGQGILLCFGLFTLALSALNLVFSGRPEKGEKSGMGVPMQLFLMLLPFLLLVLVFSYLPLWGWRYAFFFHQPGEALSRDRFAGFHWFTFLFQNEATVRDIVRVVKNTLAMSALGILTSWCPMAFAIFLSEIRNMRFRRFVQTLTTIPNFISWVLVYAVAFCIFSTDGFLSSLMVNWGLWTSGKNMLMGDSHIWLKMLGWGMWKGLGWGAIMYIAAITGIDPQLYEAATVDGAGRFQKMWHITVPELIPTFMVLLLLSIAGILNNGMEQYLVFENATNSGPIAVLDLYVYKIGIGQGVIPLSTVVGMFKSLISVALLFAANAMSKAIRGSSIV
jgi:putative aldouronate transport system permease protein